MQTAIQSAPIVRASWQEGNRHFAASRYDAAFAAYARGLQLAPREAALWFAIGAAAHSRECRREAKAAFLKAISLRPKFPEALLSLGNEIYHEGNYLGACITYLRAIAQRPLYDKAHCNLGNALSGLRKYPEAIRCYEYAIKLNPQLMAARHNLGNALMKMHEYSRAEIYFRAAIRMQPQNAQAHNSLGNALLRQENFSAAEASYRHAITLDPAYAAAHTNLANALLDQHRFREAEASYRHAIALDPTSPGGQYNLALSSLRAGNFREGWQRYEHRWDFRDLNMRSRKFKQPQLTRELFLSRTLNSKTILIHAEQGLGDTLQFARFLPHIANTGAQVIFEVQPRLQTFFAPQKNLGIAAVIAKGEKLPPFHLHCPLLSLPGILDTTIETIPSAPYLEMPPQRFTREENKLRVGLVWEGNLNSKSNQRRSASLNCFRPLLSIPGTRFISLQHGPAATQIVPTDQILNASATDESLAEAATLIATLDLIITIDTSIAHLAAGMGKPVWVMLPHRSDWRWLESATTSPWYPSMKLFRQPAENDWPSVITAVRRELQHHFALLR